jgi:hypothetical protein
VAANPNQFKGESGADGVSPSLNYTTLIEGIKTWMQSSPEVISIFRGTTGLPGDDASINYNIVRNDVNTYSAAHLSDLVSPSVIQSAFVDSNGNLIGSLSSAVSSSASSYLAANPPPGASQSQVNSWVASYLSANPQGLTSDQVNTAIAAYLVANPINSLTVEALAPLLTQLGVSFTGLSFVSLAQPSSIVSLSTPLNFDSAASKWDDLIIPTTGWSFDSTNKTLDKTSNTPNALIFQSPATTVKSFVIVIKYAPLNPNGPSAKVVISTPDGGGGENYIAWNGVKFYSGGQIGAYRANVDGTFVNRDENFSTRLDDDNYHILQFTNMNMTDWLSTKRINDFEGFHGTTGTKIQLVAVYTSNLSDAEMTANYQALLAKLPTN